MDKKNISFVKNCYGCGICELICPIKIIKIELNNEGFYGPIIDNEEYCTSCKLCISTCSYIKENTLSNRNNKIDSYAAWSIDKEIRNQCSSGGVGFEIGKLLIKQGYKVCGVKYNLNKNRAEHFVTDSIEGYQESIGSKYLQSYTVDAFASFDSKSKYFVTGTPCQIDSLRLYIQKKKIEANFVLMDFFCHGVPSYLMWLQYIDLLKEKTGNIKSISWRNKQEGWHKSYIMTAVSENPDKDNWFSMMTKGDWFYKMFLSDVCLGKACYDKCKYKLDKSSADIRIGDLWGKKYIANEEGVSAIIALTDKGKSVVANLNTCTCIQEPFEIVTEFQMKQSPNKPIIREILISQFKRGNSQKRAIRLLKAYEKIKNLQIRVKYKYTAIYNRFFGENE